MAIPFYPLRLGGMRLVKHGKNWLDGARKNKEFCPSINETKLGSPSDTNDQEQFEEAFLWVCELKYTDYYYIPQPTWLDSLPREVTNLAIISLTSDKLTHACTNGGV